jgi:tRNA 2-thiouridine synthesizing protein A
MPPAEADETLDLSGVPCPANSARALIALEGMADGRVLLVVVDDGEPVRNVPPSLEEEGHAVVRREKAGGRWRLWVRKGG